MFNVSKVTSDDKAEYKMTNPRVRSSKSKSTEATMADSRSGSPLFVLVMFGASLIFGVNAKPPSRIYGGEFAPQNYFRATVSLSHPGGGTFHSCGGGIISPNHILTAAHCVDTKNYWEISVRAGCYDLRDLSEAVEKLVLNVYMHPGYLSFIQGVRPPQNDIAVIQLKSPLTIGGRILSLKLPPGPVAVGQSYHLAGWGKNHPNKPEPEVKLKTLVMTVVANEPSCTYIPRTFCTLSSKGTACSGDSGSPLASDDYVYGITSTSRCSWDSAVTFVSVYDYVPWIKQIMAKSSK